MTLRCEGRFCSLLSEAAAARQWVGFPDGLCVCREALVRADRRRQGRQCRPSQALKGLPPAPHRLPSRRRA